MKSVFKANDEVNSKNRRRGLHIQENFNSKPQEKVTSSRKSRNIQFSDECRKCGVKLRNAYRYPFNICVRCNSK